MLVAILVQFIPLKADGELQISGHEIPVYVGMSRNITCTWTGNITELDWYLVGLEVRLATKIDNNTTKLITGRVTNIGWNGRRYVCKATTTSGKTVKKYFALWARPGE